MIETLKGGKYEKPFGTLEVLSNVGSAFFARPAGTTKGCVKKH